MTATVTDAACSPVPPWLDEAAGRSAAAAVTSAQGWPLVLANHLPISVEADQGGGGGGREHEAIGALAGSVAALAKRHRKHVDGRACGRCRNGVVTWSRNARLRVLGKALEPSGLAVMVAVAAASAEWPHDLLEATCKATVGRLVRLAVAVPVRVR